MTDYITIAIGALLLVGGFIAYIDVMKRALDFTVNAGVIRCVLCMLAIGSGGLLITFSLIP